MGASDIVFHYGLNKGRAYSLLPTEQLIENSHSSPPLVYLRKIICLSQP